MKELQKGIICLLKSSITGEKYRLPDEFKLEEAEGLIKRHSMTPLIYPGALTCGVPKTDVFMQKLFRKYLQFYQKSEGQLEEVKRIYAAFEENEIDYMPVKGCNMKALYPQPEMRVMGDADILIKIEQYPKIEKIMSDLGFTFDSKGDHDYTWLSPKLHVEVHYLLMYEYNEEYENYFGNGWKLADHQEGHRFYMSPEDEFIYLFVHFTKHYRIGGIGCRHVVDLWVYLREHPDMDFDYIREVIQKLSVSGFYDNTMKLIDVWFNDKQPDQITELMTNFIFDSGSWGTIENTSMATGVKARQETGNVSSGKAKVFIEAAFPPLDIIKYDYPVLEKHPVLLPLIWVWRWFDACLFRREKVKARTKMVKAALEGDISEYEKNLAAVGLNFTFTEENKE